MLLMTRVGELVLHLRDVRLLVGALEDRHPLSPLRDDAGHDHVSER